MAEYALNLWDYWRIIYKRKWVITGVFLVSIVSVNLFGKKTEPIYRSSVTLNVDLRTPIAELTGTGFTFWGASTAPQELSTQLELLKSYSLLSEVALDIGLISPETKESKVQSVVNSLRDKISIEKETGTSLVKITATSPNAVEAQKIAQSVADVFIEREWKNKTSEARRTKEFVEEQLDKLDKTISRLREKLKLLGAGTFARDVSIPAVDQRFRLAQLEMELKNLREVYTENYPGIINLVAEIKKTKELLKNSPESEGDRDAMMLEGDLDPDRIMSELSINEKLYTLLSERYERALIMEASQKKNVEIVDPPFLPRKPAIGPTTANIFLAAVIGLVLGLVAAFLTESLDTSIGTIEDVEEYLKIPVLGVIPQIEMGKTSEMDFWKEAPPVGERKAFEEIMSRLVIQYRPKSSVAEAYRNLQTYIKFSGIDKVGNSIMFTSASLQEGKTITSVNSALCLAQLGYKVLLIDADLRRPAVHKVFGIEREVGLSEVVLGTFKLDDAVKTMDDIMMGNIKSSIIMQTYGMENLHIITSGHLPSNPTEVLGSQNMTEFVREVKSKFQIVLFDSAPVLPVTDSCVMSSKVDGVAIVYKAGRVSRGALKRCKLQIENAKGRPIGVVLNGIRASDMKFGSPYYYYGKYYGEENEQQKGSLTTRRS